MAAFGTSVVNRMALKPGFDSGFIMTVAAY